VGVDQGVAVDAHQALRMGGFEFFQAVVAEGFALAVDEGDVFVVGHGVVEPVEFDAFDAALAADDDGVVAGGFGVRVSCCRRLVLPARSRAVARASVRTGLTR